MYKIFCTVFIYASACLSADELNIYLDADFSVYKESSHSIQMGIQVALEEHKKLLGDTKINIIPLNHRANSLRSLKNIKTFLNDPNRLAIFSGLHSPPLLANKKFINDNKALFMIPWAAAAPITRPDSNENWIFRLSVDDSKAGMFLARQIHANEKKRPFLLLEKTGWGKGNEKNLLKAFEELKINHSGVEFFNWSPTESNVRIKIRKIQNSDADCIIFVGNAGEAVTFAKAMDEFKIQLPVYSHWGILGGGFFKELGYQIISKQQWSFIQTSFSFAKEPLNEYQTKIFNLSRKLYPKEFSSRHIQAPPGFIHAYDLTSILLKAWEQSGKSVPVNFDRLRLAIEKVQGEVQGLTKVYKQPFSAYGKENIDAHEALGIEDLRLGEFNKDGNIILK